MHKNDCGCVVCQGVKNGLSQEEAFQILVDQQNKLVEETGWYGHYVPLPDGTINTHTHHLPESFNHLDFQIVLPLPIAVAMNIFQELIDKIKLGETFASGEIVSYVVKGYDVELMETIETDKPVLRVILPDADGKLGKEISKNYRFQYQV